MSIKLNHYEQFYNAGEDMMKNALSTAAPLTSNAAEYMAILSGMTDVGIRTMAVISATTIKPGHEDASIEHFVKIIETIFKAAFESALEAKNEENND